MAERLQAEIQEVKDPGGFDARAQGVTVYYLPIVCQIGSSLDDCFLAVPERITLKVIRTSQDGAGPEATGNDNKELPWDAKNRDYMPASKAVVTFTNDQMSLPALSKLLTSDGPVRYMRTGRRCRVHIGDFLDWAGRHYISPEMAQEVADEVLADRESRKAELRNCQNRTGK